MIVFGNCEGMVLETDQEVGGVEVQGQQSVRTRRVSSPSQNPPSKPPSAIFRFSSSSNMANYFCPNQFPHVDLDPVAMANAVDRFLEK